VLTTALLALLLPASAAASGRTGCMKRTNNTYVKLLDCVTLDGVRMHQTAFQAIADANGGNRAALSAGYTASAEYVANLLEDAGYDVTVAPFQFIEQVAELEQLTPVVGTYDTGAFTGSGNGEVTGSVKPVDINLVPPRASTSGCEASDFAAIDFSGPSDIALIQRGTCSFADKALNAQAAGAEAVIIFNQGNTPDRLGLIVGTLGGEDIVDIPVVGASFAQGEALAQAGSTARIEVEEVTHTDVNVLAERRGKVAPDNVVMAGAHLDGVPEGPGINDNGSGSAALLETAIMLGRLNPENTLRFAWWGAEELGLIGSTEYVENLPASELDKIALYMNYDMVGSPNYVPMVYDADESTFPAPVPVPPGSTAIEDLYESYYTSIGQKYDDSEFSGRSDYQAFIEAGVPSGGLFTGAEGLKTAEQALIWGGTVGAQFDPCYHLACDTLGNYNAHILDINSDLIAYAMLTFAFSTEAVNGVPGTPPPGGKTAPLPPPAGPEGTFTP
jgi:Zn-dependent M28 family amino/carboxypeptidase